MLIDPLFFVLRLRCVDVDVAAAGLLRSLLPSLISLVCISLRLALLLLLLLLLVRRFHKEDFFFNFGDGVIIAAVAEAVAVVVGVAEDCFLDTMILFTADLLLYIERVDWIVVLFGVFAFCYIYWRSAPSWKLRVLCGSDDED